MRRDFFPDGVAFAMAADWMWEAPTLPEEELLLSRTTVEKRRREFRAGRHCAHMALEEFGYKNFPVLRGERGEPLWPKDICGSISHAGERCIAIAAKQSDYLSLGVDIEKDREIKDDTLERISHERERFQLEQAPPFLKEVNLRAILFSAKECVHKVYYPLKHHTLDFLDVELCFDWIKQEFRVSMLSPKSTESHVIKKMSGYFGYETGYVYSRICLKSSGICE